MRAQLVTKTLEILSFDVPAIIFHNDQGKRYGAEQARTLLLQKGFQHSMSWADTPTDNGFANRVRRCAFILLARDIPNTAEAKVVKALPYLVAKAKGDRSMERKRSARATRKRANKKPS